MVPVEQPLPVPYFQSHVTLHRSGGELLCLRVYMSKPTYRPGERQLLLRSSVPPAVLFTFGSVMLRYVLTRIYIVH